MIEVLSKPAEQITAGDIESLIESEVPEGEQIEFKEKPSAKKGAVDPWMLGKGRIGDRGRDELLEEVVAFANAYGGTLLIGVKESKAKPPVAAEITSVPRCAELAERLKLVFRDCVEPEIPRIEIFAVQTKDDSGVVVFRVGRSRMAPHRVTTTRVCPVRRADRCEGMSMREIQDMTLNVSRGLERLERRLSERSERFSQEFRVLKTPEEAFGIRLTAAPVGDEIRFDRLFDQHRIIEGLEEPWREVVRRIDEYRYALQAPSIIPVPWRPILRGARAEFSYDSTPKISLGAEGGANRVQGQSSSSISGVDYICYRELHGDGLVELGFVTGPRPYREESGLWVQPDHLFILFANLIIQAHRMRYQSGVPVAEYAIEVELRAIGNSPKLMVPDYMSSPSTPEELRQGSTTFPRYSLGNRDEIPRLLNLFRRDLWNHMGTDIGAGAGELAIDDWPSED